MGKDAVIYDPRGPAVLQVDLTAEPAQDVLYASGPVLLYAYI